MIPEAQGMMTDDMRQALTERRELIQQRAAALLDAALQDGEPWTQTLGPIPAEDRAAQAWRYAARTIAAYRDRYQITGPQPLGAPPETEAQKIDAARARAALDRTQRAATPPTFQAGSRCSAPSRGTGRTL